MRGAQQIRPPLFLGTWSAPWVPWMAARATAASTSSALTWVANLAIYVPFTLTGSYPVNRLWWYNASTGGANVDMGLYSAAGTLIVHSGTTAQVGTSVPQYVSSSLLLEPDEYYFALVCSGTTATIQGLSAFGANALRSMGCMQQALASASLPATMTPAAVANALFPFCGITQTASGF